MDSGHFARPGGVSLTNCRGRCSRARRAGPGGALLQVILTVCEGAGLPVFIYLVICLLTLCLKEASWAWKVL